MGCQSSTDTMSQYQENDEFIIHQFYDKVLLFNKINAIVNNITFSFDHISQISDLAMSSILKIADNQTFQQKLQMNKIFSADVCNQIKQQKLYYKDILKIWQQKNPVLKYANKSRIYHSIANLKRDIEQQRYTKNRQNKVTYQQLEQNEIDELISLEHISHHSIKFSQKFKYVFQSMEQQHNSINNLLVNCFTPQYIKQIEKFNYNLQQKQILKAAEISRRACQYHQKGIYILLLYFIRSCSNLQKLGIIIPQMESKMKSAIMKISLLYPPGQGLQGSEQQLNKQMELVTAKGKFVTKPIKMIGQNKRAQLRSIIIQKAEIAYKNKQIFEQLIRNTCLKKSISYKAGLKLYPNNINQKAMIRIQEKMFFKAKEMQRTQQRNIEDTLTSQDQQYQKCMQKQLQNLNQINFNISDMVRAKCTFLNLQDITSTLGQIKLFIDTENEKNPGKYRIVEIQNRFTKQPPISDISLKIVLNEEIVSQLQLTLQTNIAAYNFAHIIYEFNRSKIFSKIKIVHNYYDQYTKQFNQLIKRRINLCMHDHKDPLSKIDGKILHYFDIKNYQVLNIKQMWLKNIKKHIIHKKLLSNILNLNRGQQSIMNIMFDLIIQKNHDKFIQETESLLRLKNCSWIYQSVVMLENMKDIYSKTKIQGINKQHYQLRYHEIFKQPLYKTLSYRETYFIDKIECYRKRTFKLFQQFQFNINKSSNIFDFVKYPHLIYGQKSHEYTRLLIEASSFKCKSKQYIQQYEYLKKALQNMRQLSKSENNLQILNIKLLLADNYLQQQKGKEAHQLILQILPIFKEKEQKFKSMLCQLLLADYYIQNNQFTQFNKQYKTVVDTSKAIHVPLNGQMVARCQWRIGKSCWRISEQTQNNDLKKTALNIHYRIALSQFGCYENFEELQKYLRQIGHQYEKFNLQRPILKRNQHKTVQINQIAYKQETYDILEMIDWPNLKKIQIKCIQCKFMQNTRWPNLKLLVLDNNKIGDKGCQYLKNAHWPNITLLGLYSNNIGQKGCHFLSKAKWPILQSLYLGLYNLIQLQM